MKEKRQKLAQCLTFEACEAIHNAAQIRSDDRILLEVLPGPGQPDAMAREIKYHRSCYAQYTHGKTLSCLLDRQHEAENRSQPLREGLTAFDRAFRRLAAEVQQNIISNAATGNVSRVSDLCCRYNSFL